MNRYLIVMMICFAGLIWLLSGCSDSVGPRFEMSVPVIASFKPADLTSHISTVVLTISAGDLDDQIIDTLEFAHGMVETAVDVPPGRARIFRLDAFDAQELLLYSGSDTLDIGLGDNLTVVIDMIPQALMLKVTPLYQEVLIGSDNDKYFDVYIYNAINLLGVAFRINYDNDIIEANLVELGDILGPNSTSLIRFDSGYVAVANTKHRGEPTFSGWGHLARIHFQALSVGQTPLTFDPQTASITVVSDVGDTTQIINVQVLEGGEVVVRPLMD